jgi:hypothetical protein
MGKKRNRPLYFLNGQTPETSLKILKTPPGRILGILGGSFVFGSLDTGSSPV